MRLRKTFTTIHHKTVVQCQIRVIFLGIGPSPLGKLMARYSATLTHSITQCVVIELKIGE